MLKAFINGQRIVVIFFILFGCVPQEGKSPSQNLLEETNLDDRSGLDQTTWDMNSPQSYNYMIGTQTIDPKYSFTQDHPLIETAKAIQNMGSNQIKFQFEDSSISWQILDMPFKYTFMWWNWWHSNERWGDGLSQAETDDEWNKTYDLTKRLLIRYNGTGKVFFLGNWEGDWLLIGDQNPTKDPPRAAPQGMIDWLNIRQSAVDAAKRDTPHSNVEVFHYVEVNRVLDALNENKTRVVNTVLPFVWGVDYVSYSSYDVQKLPVETVHKVLDYIESKMPPKQGIVGKRVFIGEYGIASRWVNFDPREHERQNREIMKKFLSWGAPFVLYWEMYNNEIYYSNPANPSQNKKPAELTAQEKATWSLKHNGFWLIDDKNQKQPLFDTHNQALRDGMKFVEEFQSNNGRLPRPSEYQGWLLNRLSAMP